MSGWRLRTRFVVGAVAVLVVMALAAAVVLVSYVRLIDDERRVTTTWFRAVTLSNELGAAVSSMQAGLQSFALYGDDTSLLPYEQGVRDSRDATAELAVELAREGADLAELLDEYVAAVEAWQDGYARRVVALVQAGGPEAVGTETLRSGRALGVEMQVAQRQLAEAVQEGRQQAISLLETDRERMGLVFVLGLVLLVLTVIGLYKVLQFWVLRPLDDIAKESRTVAGGDVEHEVRISGPPEFVAVATDVDDMRRRILDQLEEASAARRSLEEQRKLLATQTAELQRSNAELEQFAYVASHDLQEPLRKVASFTELLQQRYGDSLDERAHQYVEFAADGAKRMQQLVSDLLTFSRVASDEVEHVDVDLDRVLADARRQLADRVESTGAEIVAEPLPTVRGEHTLLVQLFQNLLSNSLKFHQGDGVPQVEISARPVQDGRKWELKVTDSGIGIDPAFSERIFAIFQRLNRRDEFRGTGIGLALCRKIVEHHGGHIWLDTSAHTAAATSDGAGTGRTAPEGTTFKFTLLATGHGDEAAGGHRP